MTAIRPRVHLALHLAAGGALLLWAWALGQVPSLVIHWLPWQRPLTGLGLVLVAAAGLYRRQGVSRFSCRLCVAVLGLTGFLAAGEVGFRVVGYDFRHQARALSRTPPFYRKPTIPVGEVYFRRPGPMSWTGQVIRQQLRVLGYPDAPYRSEPEITVRYDRDGFRNKDPLPPWEVAVAGDSFVELGHLRFEELFTTRLGEELGRSVRNLGVSNTGPFSHLCYLKHFGVGPTLRDAVVVFYEGNDLQDLTGEYGALRHFHRTGKRPDRTLRKQTSLLRAARELWHSAGTGSVPPLPTNAWVATRQGEVPITLTHRLDTAARPTPESLEVLAYFLSAFAAFASEQGARPWLVYMPSKVRVFQGRFRWHTPADEQNALPLSVALPGEIASACAATGVRFHDLTPALRAETSEAGILGYNGLYDTHLDGTGAAIVAKDLARRLAAPDEATTR